jgi:hypothetical protein
MLVHEDEYLVGAGRNVGRYEVAVGESGMMASAHSTVVTGMDEYLIGGRVELTQTLSALRAIEPVIRATLKQHQAASKTTT